MTRNPDGGSFTLSTGRRFYANNCIIGLSVGAEKGLAITEGYDGPVLTDRMTEREVLEIAEFMVDQWKDFAAAQRDLICGAPTK
jgi:hypothetical protein